MPALPPNQDLRQELSSAHTEPLSPTMPHSYEARSGFFFFYKAENPSCYDGRTMNYLEKLNSAQKEAVLHTDGPLIIIAGAG